MQKITKKILVPFDEHEAFLTSVAIVEQSKEYFRTKENNVEQILRALWEIVPPELQLKIYKDPELVERFNIWFSNEQVGTDKKEAIETIKLKIEVDVN